jgi:hypothetical protein
MKVRAMRKTHGVVVTLVFALLLGLLLAAGPAMATTTLNTLQATYVAELYPGDGEFDADWNLTFWDWVAYTETVRTTGPDGWRFQAAYNVVRLDGVIPFKGDNVHWGDVAIVSRDPAGIVYDPDASLVDNLAGYGLLWTGSWEGYTLNKRTHKAVMELAGWPSSWNVGYSAHIDVDCGGFDLANARSGVYVVTPWNMRAYVTSP